jgi:arylsulfatase
MHKSVPFKRTMIASVLSLAAGAVSTVHAAPATSTAPENAPKQDSSKPRSVKRLRGLQR